MRRVAARRTRVAAWRTRVAARFMCIPVAAIIGLLISAATPFDQSAITSADIVHSDPVSRGGLLTVRYRGDAPLSTLAIDVRDATGELVRSTAGFRYRDSGGTMRWAALVGIPSTATAGRYMLAVTATGAGRRGGGGGNGGDRVVISSFTVSDRSFNREIIPLTARLTSIRTDVDAKKTEQARRYARIINTPTPAALFSGGIFLLPVRGRRITSRFGDRRVYAYDDGSEGHSVHNGIDYGAPTGVPVRAAAAGLVRMAEERITTGNTIVLEHLPGVMTVYFHLDTMEVAPNETVARGEHIGAVGATGLATGAHLHWELRAGGVGVDPSPYLIRPLLDISR